MFHIYYINLTSRPDRNDNMLKVLQNFKKFNIEFERINAIDGNSININELTRIGIIDIESNNFNRPLKRGEIACTLSHMESWRRFLYSTYNYGIFFEDDILISQPYFDNIMEKVIDLIPKTIFDWCYLSFNSLGELDVYEGLDIKNVFYRVITPGYGTHAYILNKYGCKKILNYYQQQKIFHPLDFMHVFKSEYKKIFNQPFEIISVKPDFYYYKTFNKDTFVYNKGKEFPIYVNDFADSDTSNIV